MVFLYFWVMPGDNAFASSMPRSHADCSACRCWRVHRTFSADLRSTEFVNVLRPNMRWGDRYVLGWKRSGLCGSRCRHRRCRWRGTPLPPDPLAKFYRMSTVSCWPWHCALVLFFARLDNDINNWLCSVESWSCLKTHLADFRGPVWVSCLHNTGNSDRTPKLGLMCFDLSGCSFRCRIVALRKSTEYVQKG